MVSTQRLPRTVSKKINRDDKKTGALRKEVSDRFSVNATYQGLVITLGIIGYSTI